jgi:hypothetical protein
VLFGALVQHDIGDQAGGLAGLRPGDDGGLAHGRVQQQGGLDLAGLDAEAPDLDLLVVAAVELQLAVGAPAGAVAGAVQARAGRAVGVGGEAAGGVAGAAEVAAGQAGAGQGELADDPGRAQPAEAVEHIGAVVGQRCADGQQGRQGPWSGTRQAVASMQASVGP